MHYLAGRASGCANTRASVQKRDASCYFRAFGALGRAQAKCIYAQVRRARG